MAGSFAHCDSPHDNAHPFRDSQSLHYPSESGALLWILDLTRDPELVGQRSQDEVATWKGDISCYPGSLVSNRPLGHLDDEFRAYRIKVGDILGRDLLGAGFLFSAPLPVDLLKAVIQGRRNCVPEVEEGILLHSDVYEHCLETGFDILDSSFEDASDDIEIAFTLYFVFFKDAVFEEGYPSLKLLGINDNSVALPC